MSNISSFCMKLGMTFPAPVFIWIMKLGQLGIRLKKTLAVRISQ